MFTLKRKGVLPARKTVKRGKNNESHVRGQFPGCLFFRLPEFIWFRKVFEECFRERFCELF
jgi:hypothetical protein